MEGVQDRKLSNQDNQANPDKKFLYLLTEEEDKRIKSQPPEPMVEATVSIRTLLKSLKNLPKAASR
jgi:hypothetical protein